MRRARARAGLGIAAKPGEQPVEAPTAKPKRERQPAKKHDPKMVAAARELRDRYLEEFNSGRVQIEAARASGKYDVSRRRGDGGRKQTPLLAA